MWDVPKQNATTAAKSNTGVSLEGVAGAGSRGPVGSAGEGYLQGYVAHKKVPPPHNHRGSLGMGLL
ncbi:hypothetical protein T484DRAFT_1972180 [Baffinella frigidus]|nr:hypothetical protein T484DRAFT_1972180 [Cryptophyta sp. CCMP2293]